MKQPGVPLSATTATGIIQAWLANRMSKHSHHRMTRVRKKPALVPALRSLGLRNGTPGLPAMQLADSEISASAAGLMASRRDSTISKKLPF